MLVVYGALILITEDLVCLCDCFELCFRLFPTVFWDFVWVVLQRSLGKEEDGQSGIMYKNWDGRSCCGRTFR